MKQPLKNMIHLDRAIILAWIICVTFIVMISLTSRYVHGVHYFIDLFSHFQLQYFLAILFLLLAGLLIPKLDKRALIPLLLFQLFQFVTIVPFKITSADNDFAASSNLFFINANYHTLGDDISAYIKEQNTPTVAVVEANEEIISDLTGMYGAPISREGLGAQTCTIFSNDSFEYYPIDQDRYRYPICSARNNDLVLVVIHPYPPFGNEYYFDQIEHFESVADLLEEINNDGYNYILMGDFNSTIYSPVFRKEFDNIFERNNYTWSASLPVMLPIDHAMSNVEIEVQPSEKLSSDHSGLFIQY